jgi:3'-phosphoadenosine 5'-phosphosulfate sulfotransferase (PAPS reductase)/FAD synthetase
MEIIFRQRNPYFIQGPAQIGFSGGRSSAYMLYHILDAHNGELPDNVYVTFQNTGKEREETLVFIHEIENRWGLKIHWLEYNREWQSPDAGRHEIEKIISDLLPITEYEIDIQAMHFKEISFETASRNGEPFKAMLDYYKDYRREIKGEPAILPNPTNRMCTDRLKIKIAAQFMRQFYSNWDAIIGIRYDEPRRYHRMMSANEKKLNRWQTSCPMYESRVIKEQVNEFWSKQSFDLGMHSDFGNCDLCFLKHESKIMRALTENPTAADWWVEQEFHTGQVFRRDRPNYRQLKWYAEQMGSQESFEFGEDLADCMCGD